MSVVKRYRIRLLGDDEGGSDVKSLIVSFRGDKAFGSKVRVPVKGTFNNVPLQSPGLYR